MFDFKTILPTTITKDTIFRVLGQENVFRYYFGEFKLHKAYNSPFYDDKNPSASFYYNKSGVLILKHFSNRFPDMNCIDFVMCLLGLSFTEALNRIWSDLNNTDLISEEEIQKLYRSTTKQVQVSLRPYTTDSLKYWKQYYITKKELLDDHIYLVDTVFVNKVPIKSEYYSYVKIEDNYLKIYTPEHENNKYKWLSSVPLNFPFGRSSIKQSEYNIVTKSFKDRLIIKKFTDQVINLQNESEHSFLEADQILLLENAPKNFIWFDADEVGKKAALVYNKFTPVFIPDKDYTILKIKDPSDYVKYYGLDLFEDLYTDLILKRI